ncbi:putative sugar phosphate transporter domain-containing protein [Helianthus annuus]|nr:putative sugar phosphate transporter domain-containing protein [Helianthus annuus]
MKGKSVSGMNYYACLSMLSLLILTPFTIVMEGPQMWEAGWQTALTQVGPNIVWWVVAQSVFYHLYNQVSYMSLDQISPLTFSVGNTMKRISVIVASIINLSHTPPTSQRTWSCYSYPWNFHLFPGKTVKMVMEEGVFLE